MSTECSQFVFGFHPQKRREIRAQFDGGAITSDGGGLLLREVEKRIGMLHQFAACFTDYRNPDLIEHKVEEMVAQRVYGLALGYEDLNDHEELRNDPLLAVLIEKADPSSQVLAGKSTLNRLELTKETASRKERYKKIVLDHGAVDRLLVQVFLEAHQEAPQEIILDLDATDDPLHGKQEGRFFHGYYGHYCYLPLYIFCGEFLLGARLRSSNIDASAGSVEELKRIVAQIRSAWPKVRMVVRGDSGFCREELLAWCEAEGVDYLLGLAKNERLKAEIEKEMGDGRGESTVPGDRTPGPVVQRVALSDAEELEPSATGGGQGRTSGEGRKPAIRGDLSEYRSPASAGVVRRTVLCARRHGGSHQGATDAVQ